MANRPTTSPLAGHEVDFTLLAAAAAGHADARFDSELMAPTITWPAAVLG